MSRRGSFSNDPDATLDDLREAVEILEAVAPLWTRILGEAHPETPSVQGALATASETPRARARIGVARGGERGGEVLSNLLLVLVFP